MKILPVVLTLLLGGSLSAQLLGDLQTIAVGAIGPPFGFAAGDLDGDGAPDLVAVDVTGRARVLLGDGLGGFGPAVMHAPFPSPPFVFARDTFQTDANGDGNLDLWVSHALGGVGIALGDGHGAYTSVVPISGGTGPVAVSDVNLDRKPDLLTGTTNGVGLALNNGSGGFGPFTQVASVLLVPTSILAGDLDRDGDPDLVTADAFGQVEVFLGDGQGGFATAGPPVLLAAVGPLATLADLDGDGYLDFAAGTLSGLILLINAGAGSFGWPQHVPAPALSRPAVADIDGDGNPDIVAASTNAVLLYAGDGSGKFGPPQSFPTGAVDPSPARLALSDFDGDGRIDVAVCGDAANGLRILRNLSPTPTGVSAYGTGTGACAGTIGIWATPGPVLGTPDFRILCSNAPPNGSGLLLLGLRRDIAGWNPFRLGFLLHVGPIAIPMPMRSDAGGSAALALPLPRLPLLAGLRVYAQSLWIGDPGLGNTCSPASFELASSRGLSLTLQR